MRRKKRFALSGHPTCQGQGQIRLVQVGCMGKKQGRDISTPWDGKGEDDDRIARRRCPPTVAVWRLVLTTTGREGGCPLVPSYIFVSSVR